MNVLITPVVFCFLFTQFSCFVKLLFPLSVFSLSFSPISSGAFLWLCSKLWIKNMLDETLADVEHNAPPDGTDIRYQAFAAYSSNMPHLPSCS